MRSRCRSSRRCLPRERADLEPDARPARDPRPRRHLQGHPHGARQPVRPPSCPMATRAPSSARSSLCSGTCSLHTDPPPRQPRVHPLRGLGRRVPYRATVQAPGQLPQHEQDRGEGRRRDASVELEAIVDDYYQSESQTLTTAAELNLLKLAELHRRLTPKGAVLGRHQGRVHSPAPDGRRRRRSCEPLGRDAVPRRELSEIRGALGNPSSTAELRAELRAIRGTPTLSPSLPPSRAGSAARLTRPTPPPSLPPSCAGSAARSTRPTRLRSSPTSFASCARSCCTP